MCNQCRTQFLISTVIDIAYRWTRQQTLWPPTSSAMTCVARRACCWCAHQWWARSAGGRLWRDLWRHWRPPGIPVVRSSAKGQHPRVRPFCHADCDARDSRARPAVLSGRARSLAYPSAHSVEASDAGMVGSCAPPRGVWVTSSAWVVRLPVVSSSTPMP